MKAVKCKFRLLKSTFFWFYNAKNHPLTDSRPVLWFWICSYSTPMCLSKYCLTSYSQYGIQVQLKSTNIGSNKLLYVYYILLRSLVRISPKHQLTIKERNIFCNWGKPNLCMFIAVIEFITNVLLRVGRSFFVNNFFLFSFCSIE